MRRSAILLAVAALALGMACTVDELVGSNALADGGGGDGGTGNDGGTAGDGGTPVCPGTGPDCAPVCGSQTCHSGCTELHDCVTHCDGTSCTFSCERSGGQVCTQSCSPGPCTLNCTQVAETLECSMSCNPAQTCVADCHGGTCTVACGQIEPATRCDGGVYSCSDVCGG